MSSFTKESRPDAYVIDQCIFSIAQGNDEALRTLYDLTSSAIYAYALSVTKNKFDAQDVMHDTFIKVYESAHLYQSQRKPMAWILTIVKNLCYTKFRQQSRFCDVTDDVIERHFAGNTNMSVEDKLVVTKCLAQLADDERTIVVMHAMTGLKHKDIAAHMGMPLSTVLSKYNRALKKLKGYLKGEQQ